MIIIIEIHIANSSRLSSDNTSLGISSRRNPILMITLPFNSGIETSVAYTSRIEVARGWFNQTITFGDRDDHVEGYRRTIFELGHSFGLPSLFPSI
jgi:hypothetical protein